MGRRARMPSQKAIMAKEAQNLKGRTQRRRRNPEVVQKGVVMGRAQSSLKSNESVNSAGEFDGGMRYTLEHIAPIKKGRQNMVEIELEDIQSEVEYWGNANGVIVVRFETVGGKQQVLQGGIYHFDNKPFIVKEWTPELEFTREELLTVLIWIKFSGLDFKYWSRKGLSKIGSLIGKPLMVDHNTEEGNGLNFARLLVEVEMGAELPDEMRFKN
ncbi:hypothetical protein BC332_16529 [Capsicum chinense]|nr:hypothetical protein BC332_16529 [Capsicum chinense]